MATWYEKPCATCGIEFRVKPYRQDTAKYCSFACRNSDHDYRSLVSRGKLGVKKSPKEVERIRLRAKQNVGCKNPNWKGGRTPLALAIRFSVKYSEWRLSVYKRDHFTCQQCGKKESDNIVAHHVKKFAVILAQNEIKSLEQAESCDELWDIANGQTLCNQCHEKTNTFKANGQNVGKKFDAEHCTSRHKGVHRRKVDGKWVARISGGAKRLYLGSYNSEIEAANAYNVAAQRRYGCNAVLNKLEIQP